MTEPLDRSRRDSILFQFTTKQLRDFIDPNHLLIRIDEQLDFAKLVEPLEGFYCPDFGRPAIHPEVMVKALLICSLYNIASFPRLCLAISKNIARRWVCFLTIDDPVFDHSSISHFYRSDRPGRLRGDLRRSERRAAAVGDVVAGDVRGCQLVQGQRERLRTWRPAGCRWRSSRNRAIEENGLFVLTATTVADDSIEHEEFRYFQQPSHFNILLDCLAPLAMTVRVETGTTRCFAPAPTRWFGLWSQSLRSARRTGP